MALMSMRGTRPLPHLRPGTNALAIELGAGWWSNSGGNQPGAIQAPPSVYLDAGIVRLER